MHWLKDKWQRFKVWFIGLLIAIGLVAAPVVFATDATYTPASTYEDGTNLPLTEIAETRLYCNGGATPAITEPGADGAFENLEATLSAGDNTCYATHVSTNGLESLPSNEVTFRIIPQVRPNPPVLD